MKVSPGSIRQLPSGQWTLRVSRAGSQLTYGTFPTEDDALDAQARWRLTHLLPSEDPTLGGDTLNAMQAVTTNAGRSCNEWFDLWLAAKGRRLTSRVVGRKRGGAASTEARDRSQWKPWWQPVIGALTPQTVTRQTVEGILTELEERRSPNTVRTHWVMIRAFFNWLDEQDVTPANPTKGIDVSVNSAHDRVRPVVVPDFTFINLLSSRLSGQDLLVLELLLATGGRRSEIAGLKIEDVDFARDQVWIREPIVEASGKLVRAPHPKGGKKQAVPIASDLASLLRTHVARLNGKPTDPLIQSPNGQPLRWNNYQARTLRPAIRSATAQWALQERRRLVAGGTTYRDATAQVRSEAAILKHLTPHHLRHTAAALLWAAGASDIEVQLILRHADVETSRRLYAHLLRGAASNAVSRVQDLRKIRSE